MRALVLLLDDFDEFAGLGGFGDEGEDMLGGSGGRELSVGDVVAGELVETLVDLLCR